MMRIFFVIIVILMSIPASLSAPVKIDSQPILTKLLKQYIQPSYANFERQTSLLVDKTQELCGQPSGIQLTATQEQFAKVATTWSHIEWLRVGPVMSENRLERVLFYPDRKSTGLRQVQRALGKQDETVLETSSLAKKSVAMQGLGALEFILFGTGFETLLENKYQYRCLYGLAISKNLHQIALEIEDGWQIGSVFADSWIAPDPDNPLFRNDFEALNRVIGTIIHGLEAQRDARIGAFLKDDAEKDRPKSALLWRSELSLAMIAGGLTGLTNMYQISDLADFIPEDQSWLKSSMMFELEQSIRTAETFSGSVLSLLQDIKSRERLVYLDLAIDFAIKRLDGAVAPALGLQAGFSFGDGD